MIVERAPIVEERSGIGNCAIIGRTGDPVFVPF